MTPEEWKAEDNEHGIKVGGRQINNLCYADDRTLLTTTEESTNDMAVKQDIQYVV